MILCIDDEPKGLQIRKRLLELQGYDVLVANSGAEALQIADHHAVQAVVLDFAMPEMDGGAVAEQLKRKHPDIKILLLSAYVDLPVEALQWVDARSVKGDSPLAFLKALQQLLA